VIFPEPTIASIRAFVCRGGGADYHDQGDAHWIDDHIASPMARYPEYRQSRASFGINVLGSLIVEIEASDGSVGFAVTTGGEIGAFIVEKHLARFIEGRRVSEIETMWDQMYWASVFYGRKGIVLNAISGVDLALWDLLGQVRRVPVHALLGKPAREELRFYATGPRPDLAKEMGFVGGKMPLKHGPAEGDAGMKRNVEQVAAMRRRVGAEFWLMYDCWMSLDEAYAKRLAEATSEHGLKWLEECLPPDDYWGYASLRKSLPKGMWLTSGEHEATRWGFRLLLEMGCCDVIQPDVGWCGGLSELVKIAALAREHDTLVVPHGSSVYSYHFVLTCEQSPFAEFLMMAPQADKVVPMFSPLLLDEPVPVAGRMKASALDKPGFGVRLNRSLEFHRPYSH
jgi:L-rhamnonate dehydratase